MEERSKIKIIKYKDRKKNNMKIRKGKIKSFRKNGKINEMRKWIT